MPLPRQERNVMIKKFKARNVPPHRQQLRNGYAVEKKQMNTGIVIENAGIARSAGQKKKKRS